MSDKFRIHKTGAPHFPWAMDYPVGFRDDDRLGIACSTFEIAVAEFIDASELQCPDCGKGAVVDRSWGWECTACGSYDVAVGCVKP